eukprot:GDKI01011647.1.p1 GENE.GDKI01011647.1~~GDKI01011647.1.p1  ORF type:complete len:371 (+),score=26.05 GDKI01011647.1:43-1113(+)
MTVQNGKIDKSPEVVIHKCTPEYWLWLPKNVRIAFAWITITLFSLSFMSPILFFLLLVPYLWKIAPIVMGSIAFSLVLSYVIPLREWLWFRKIGQLWYEVFDFHCNLSPEEIENILIHGDTKQLILAMHPHGIVPFQAILWAAYCDQYFTVGKRALYGFAAAADAVGYVPFLRNVMGFLGAGSASYKALKDGLVEGKVPSVPNRRPRHLYILPGGVAEIFRSKPGAHEIIFKHRKGLVRLAIETGAELCPCYVFGGTDFYQNLATNDGVFARLSRKLRAGFTIFWGYAGLPIPFAPKVTMCIGAPIPTPKLPPNATQEERDAAVNALHTQFMENIHALFDKYKSAAGYPDAKLIIH